MSQHSKLNISFYSCSLNIDTPWSSLLLYFFLKCVTALKFQRIVLAKIDWVLLRCSIILSSDCRPTGTTDLGKFKILHFPKKLQLFSFFLKLYNYIIKFTLASSTKLPNNFTAVYKPQFYTNRFKYEMIFFNFHWLLRNLRHSKQEDKIKDKFRKILTDWGFHSFVNLILMALCAYVVGQFPLFLAETYHVRSKTLKAIYLPLGRH